MAELPNRVSDNCARQELTLPHYRFGSPIHGCLHVSALFVLTHAAALINKLQHYTTAAVPPISELLAATPRKLVQGWRARREPSTVEPDPTVSRNK